MARAFLHMLADRRGAGAAEFALVLPLLLLLLFGMIDSGRMFFEINEARKATQVGARVAAVTNLVEPGLSGSYLGKTYTDSGGTTRTLFQGDRIPKEALGTVTCNTTQCTCQTAPCPTAGTYDGTAFDTVVARMTNLYAPISDSNVIIRYSGSGLGYAGNPHGADVSPAVTVELTGISFRPLTFFGLGTLTLPNLNSTVTAEDMVGAQSN